LLTDAAADEHSLFEICLWLFVVVAVVIVTANRVWFAERQAIIKGLNTSLQTCLGKDLQYFMPTTILQPGTPFVLDPPTVEERALLTCAHS
jgi:hypothetical protein